MTNSYPNTHKGEETDEYFGVRVKDPFRWLENDKSEEVKKWLKEEQEYTENYLQNIPFREKIFADLEERWNVEKTSLPLNAEIGFIFSRTQVCKLSPFCTDAKQDKVKAKPKSFLILCPCLTITKLPFPV